MFKRESKRSVCLWWEEAGMIWLGTAVECEEIKESICSIFFLLNLLVGHWQNLRQQLNTSLLGAVARFWQVTWTDRWNFVFFLFHFSSTCSVVYIVVLTLPLLKKKKRKKRNSFSHSLSLSFSHFASFSLYFFLRRPRRGEKKGHQKSRKKVMRNVRRSLWIGHQLLKCMCLCVGTF